MREFGLCVNLHSGDLVAQWKGVNRLYITQLRGSLGAFRVFPCAAAGALKGPKVGFLLGRNCRFEIQIGVARCGERRVTRRGAARRAAWGLS